MVSSSLRVVLCAVVGLFAGGILGILFVPDPTGLLASVLALVLAVVISGGLHRTDWLRETTDWPDETGGKERWSDPLTAVIAAK